MTHHGSIQLGLEPTLRLLRALTAASAARLLISEARLGMGFFARVLSSQNAPHMTSRDVMVRSLAMLGCSGGFCHSASCAMGTEAKPPEAFTTS